MAFFYFEIIHFKYFTQCGDDVVKRQNLLNVKLLGDRSVDTDTFARVHSNARTVHPL